jgi:hypothetical protein
MIMKKNVNTFINKSMSYVNYVEDVTKNIKKIKNVIPYN